MYTVPLHSPPEDLDTSNPQMADLPRQQMKLDDSP
jgi:hypothetical protein